MRSAEFAPTPPGLPAISPARGEIERFGVSPITLVIGESRCGI